MLAMGIRATARRGRESPVKTPQAQGPALQAALIVAVEPGRRRLRPLITYRPREIAALPYPFIRALPERNAVRLHKRSDTFPAEGGVVPPRRFAHAER